VIAPSSLTQGGTRHAATRESSVAGSPTSTPAPEEAEPRASISTDDGDAGFHTAEEDEEDDHHASVRRTELETKRLERERGEGVGMRKYIDGVEEAEKGVEKLAVK